MGEKFDFKSSVYFTFTAHLSLEEPCFKCPVVTCGSGCHAGSVVLQRPSKSCSFEVSDPCHLWMSVAGRLSVAKVERLSQPLTE